ncbi:hypothetical protein TBLA_0F04090 [Henningerozyma blattae CBS 6284]|uniref:PPIase cyclophilin-type domain-containing protein n=1 Tax=Henningerozyma blattae (strain ATCC 34711 / CBS 6284 / DSM 70876 / NBRC 10599 / NRRL Y-10934 / UCD 77-7) TaxID=1071380 RepID=I2H6E0_HENB6|nr:hypothetical protein TBLA_0F04090 [Tetrapisispora blattae CBS 6284]CCH61942.1 hypothetical protein TBLA_0F04090 [Tetrapisispora blattae CBS 6284]
MLAYNLVSWILIFCDLVLSAPTTLDSTAKGSSAQLTTDETRVDFNKIYEPSPPVTSHCFLTIRYFDELLQEYRLHTITIALYGSITPKTFGNFDKLAKGIVVPVGDSIPPKRVKVKYEGNSINKIIPGKSMLTGDVLYGIAKFSTLGPAWEEENFVLRHDRPGRVVMANEGTLGTLNSKFYIETSPEAQPEFDEKTVVFGQVINGLQELINISKNTKLDSESKPVNPMNIEHIIMAPLILGNIKDKQVTYLDRVGRYRKGELELGERLADLDTNVLSKEFIPLTDEQSALRAKQRGQAQSTSQLKELLVVISVIIFIVLTLNKYKREIFGKKVVSMRKY